MTKLSKNIFIIILFTLLCLFSFSACNSNPKTELTSIAQALENARLDLSGAKSVGLIKRSTNNISLTTIDNADSVKSNVLVTIDEENAVDDATYIKSEDSEDGDESEVEVKSWYVRNLKVTDNFVFVYYVNYECNMVTDMFTSKGNNDQSFAIHKQTGKVYPLNELSNIDMVLENGDFLRYNNKFYKAIVVSGELKLTKLSSNDNIKEYFAMEDKWGNIYVQNDSIHEQKLDNLYYYKDEYQIFYGLGDDGIIYKTYIMYNITSNTRVEYFDQNMQNVLVTTPLSVAVKSVRDSYGYGLIFTSHFIFKGNNCFYINGNSMSFFELNGIPWKSDYFDYTGYADTWDISYKNIRSYKNVYFIDGEIIIATETELAHFDMNSYNGWPTEQFTKIADYNSAKLKGNILTITTEGIQGVITSFIYVENGQVKTELLSEIFYDTEIITIQPLN